MYSIDDLYLFGLAQVWAAGGLTFEAIDKVLPLIDREWLHPDRRGRLLIARLNSEAPHVQHFPGTIRGRELEAQHVRALLKLKGDVHGSMTFNLKAILDWVDERISAVGITRAHA